MVCWERQDKRDVIRLALLRLPPVPRLVVILACDEGCTAAEIAEILRDQATLSPDDVDRIRRAALAWIAARVGGRAGQCA